MAQGYFITGTDTGVGKTLIAVGLARAAVARGARTGIMKPVAAGCVMSAEGWMNEDVVALRAAANVALPLSVVNPYAFEPAIAPHIAAAQAGVCIDLDVIDMAYRQIAAQSEVVIVEGAGGFRIPLNESQDSADLAVRLGLPVVLVVGMRLGCLNHALLTTEAIVRRGLVLAGWVANTIDSEMTAFDENLATLTARIAAPCLGVVPHLAGPDSFPIAESCIRFPDIFMEY